MPCHRAQKQSAYTEAEAFYRRAKVRTVMECQSADGPVRVRFENTGEYTVPAAALKTP
jgi:hypothetical protein